MLTNRFSAVLATASLLLLTPFVVGEETAQKVKGVRVIAKNLDNPSGIAIQPGTGHLFVAHHPGVIRLVRGEDKSFSQSVEIGDYPSDVYGKGPMYDIGPLGVAFLGNDQIVVGDGSRPDGEEVIRVYKVGKTAAEKPQAENAALATIGPIEGGEASAKGEGNYYAVAVTNDAIYATSNGDDTKGWIVRSVLKDGKPGEIEPFIATKEVLQVDAPCGITVNQDGDLVVSQMGEISVPQDSLLTIYDAKTGKLKHSYETGLHDIIGLAYSPEGKLYAVDFAWLDAKQGGLYELTIEGDAVNARKVMALDKPTSLAFAKNGALFVTVFGTAEEGATNKPGKVLRIAKEAL